jgi:RNA polymerase sigma-70 factor (ECF subfamily)
MEDRRLGTLIPQVQAGQPAALDELVDLFQPRVYGFVAKMIGPGPDAEEITQEVFLRVIRTLPEYKHDGRFTAWIFRIAANLVRDRMRRRKRDGPLFSGGSAEGSAGGDDDRDDPLARAPDRGPAPEEPLGLAEDVDRMRWALSQLGDAEREAILLRHYSDMAFKEIADATGCPLGTVLARVHRGLKRLRSLMESAEAKPGPAGKVRTT